MKKPTNKVVFVHLLNDFSGSPRVLTQVIESCTAAGIEANLFCSNTRQGGFLDNLKGCKQHTIPYRWSSNKLLTLCFFVWSQVALFVKLLRYRKEDVTIYVNTALPFAAGWAGKLTGKPVIYHIHETSIKPAPLKKLLFGTVSRTADQLIYVSQFLKDQEPIAHIPSAVVPNALSPEFLEESQKASPLKVGPFRVLMLSSLKTYKGIVDFVQLAGAFPELAFELVLNASPEAVAQFFNEIHIPENLILHGAQSNVHPFYQRADLVLNLSHPDQWVETFGLTALEAMSYGIPVIVPPVGGIAEVVEHRKSGYQIHVGNTELLHKAVSRLSEEPEHYQKMATEAEARSRFFSPERMQQAILRLIQKTSQSQKNSRFEKNYSTSNFIIS